MTRNTSGLVKLKTKAEYKQMARSSEIYQVRGVPAETRKLAKMGAVVAGQTVGQWVTAALRNYAGMQRVLEPEKFLENQGEGGGVDVAVEANRAPIVEPAKEPFKKTLSPRAKKVKTCSHGLPTGVNCWQCGGIAKVGA